MISLPETKALNFGFHQNKKSYKQADRMSLKILLRELRHFYQIRFREINYSLGNRALIIEAISCGFRQILLHLKDKEKMALTQPKNPNVQKMKRYRIVFIFQKVLVSIYHAKRHRTHISIIDLLNNKTMEIIYI